VAEFNFYLLCYILQYLYVDTKSCVIIQPYTDGFFAHSFLKYWTIFSRKIRVN